MAFAPCLMQVSIKFNQGQTERKLSEWHRPPGWRFLAGGRSKAGQKSG